MPGRAAPDQPGFFEVRPEIALDFHARNSFAKAVTPEYHRLYPEDYQVSDAERDYVTPDLLESSLFGVNKKAPNAVCLVNTDARKNIWIAVSAPEHKQLAGNVETLGNRVVSHVLASRPRRTDFTEDRAAAERGGVHAVTRVRDNLNTYRSTTLNQHTATISWLQKSAESPGYAWKDGLSVRQEIGVAKDIIFEEMLSAMSVANNWTPEKTDGIRRVITHRLFFDRAHNAHIHNWQVMLGIAEKYIGYKKELYDAKIAKAEEYIQKHDVSES